MKKILFLLLLIFCILFFLGRPSGEAIGKSFTENNDIEEELDNTINQQLDEIDWDTFQSFLEEHAEENYGLFNGSIFSTTKDILSGNFSTDATSFLQYLLNIFLVKLENLFPVLTGIAVICILSGVIGKTRSNLLNESTGNLINFFFFSTVLLLLLTGVWDLYNIAKEAIYSIKGLSNISMPILITLMTATGAKVSSKVYTPAVALLSEGVTEIVSGVVLPMFVFCVVFCIISNLSQEIKLHQLANFFKKVSSWILGITFTVFTGFLAIQGLTAATIDGVSIRAAKFATKAYIPILGGYLADGFDLILTSCVLIKNSFGVVVLLIVLSIVLSPIIHIIVFNIGLNIVTALTEPIADKSIVGFLVDICKSLSILLASVLAVTFMLFLLIMMMIFSANVF